MTPRKKTKKKRKTVRSLTWKKERNKEKKTKDRKKITQEENNKKKEKKTVRSLTSKKEREKERKIRTLLGIY